jgi:ribulose kinase
VDGQLVTVVSGGHDAHGGWIVTVLVVVAVEVMMLAGTVTVNVVVRVIG